MIGIYQITNLKSGKMYIGQSVDIDKRIHDHIYELSNNVHSNRYLQAAWNKYGKSNFVFSVLQETSEEELTAAEKYWVDYYGGYESDYLYNLREPGPKGKLSADALRKLSESQKKLREDPEFCKKLSEGAKRSWTEERRQAWSRQLTGRELSEKHIESLRAAAKRKQGIPRPAKVKQKISNTLKGHAVSDETREKLRQAALKQERRKLTPEEREHRRQKAKEYWQRKKQLQEECQEVR